MLDKLKKFTKDSGKNKYLYLLIGIALIGIMMTYLPGSNQSAQNISSKGQDGQKSSALKAEDSNESYERQLEKRLIKILRQMEGVGQVDVMITLAANEEKIYAQEKVQNTESQEEEDAQGNKRVYHKDDLESKIMMQNGEVPVIIKEKTPQIEGVLVLAQGAGNSEVKNNIILSVSSLLDVPVHKISVFKMKQ